MFYGYLIEERRLLSLFRNSKDECVKILSSGRLYIGLYSGLLFGSVSMIMFRISSSSKHVCLRLREHALIVFHECRQGDFHRCGNMQVASR
jgi:hypothetical protein